MYDPASKQWKAWKPSDQSQIYAVYVDDHDKVWLTEWSSNAILRFDPETETFSMTLEQAFVTEMKHERHVVSAAL